MILEIEHLKHVNYILSQRCKNENHGQSLDEHVESSQSPYSQGIFAYCIFMICLYDAKSSSVSLWLGYDLTLQALFPFHFWLLSNRMC